MKSKIADSVYLFLRNPCRELLMRLNLSKKLDILLYMHFSYILLKQFKMETGRLLLRSLVLPDLCRGITFAIFRESGNIPVFSARLIE